VIAGERRIEVAGLSFAVRAEAQMGEALEHLIPAAPASALPVDERVKLVEGNKHLTVAEGGEIVATTPLEEVSAAVRGMLVAALDARQGALLHGAGAVLSGRAVLCIAPSEGGKTTLCGKLRGRAPILSDETIALWLEGGKPELAGTCFWSGPKLPTATGRFPLAAVCFLKQGGEGLEPIARAEAVGALLAEWHLPERPNAISDALERASRLLSVVPFVRLRSRLESDPLPLLSAAMQLAASS
jgi:hypothetical protein